MGCAASPVKRRGPAASGELASTLQGVCWPGKPGSARWRISSEWASCSCQRQSVSHRIRQCGQEAKLACRPCSAPAPSENCTPLQGSALAGVKAALPGGATTLAHDTAIPWRAAHPRSRGRGRRRRRRTA